VDLAVAARVGALDHIARVDGVVVAPGISLKRKGHLAGRASVLLRVGKEMALELPPPLVAFTASGSRTFQNTMSFHVVPKDDSASVSLVAEIAVELLPPLLVELQHSVIFSGCTSGLDARRLGEMLPDVTAGTGDPEHDRSTKPPSSGNGAAAHCCSWTKPCFAPSCSMARETTPLPNSYACVREHTTPTELLTLSNTSLGLGTLSITDAPFEVLLSEKNCPLEGVRNTGPAELSC